MSKFRHQATASEVFHSGRVNRQDYSINTAIASQGCVSRGFSRPDLAYPLGAMLYSLLYVLQCTTQGTTLCAILGV